MAGATEAVGPIAGNGMIQGAATIDLRKRTSQPHLELEIAAEMNKSVVVSQFDVGPASFFLPAENRC
jgi:hypothetical protein